MVAVKYTLNWLLLSKSEFSTLPTHQSGWKWTCCKNSDNAFATFDPISSSWLIGKGESTSVGKYYLFCQFQTKIWGLQEFCTHETFDDQWWICSQQSDANDLSNTSKKSMHCLKMPKTAFLGWKNFPLEFFSRHHLRSLFVHSENDSWKMLILLALSLLCLEQSLAEDKDRDKCKHKVEYEFKQKVGYKDIRMTKVLLLKTRTRMRMRRKVRRRTETRLKAETRAKIGRRRRLASWGRQWWWFGVDSNLRVRKMMLKTRTSWHEDKDEDEDENEIEDKDDI